MKSFMRANKWLIREFPENLGIKHAILATQISSLFNSELRTPSLVYAIQNGLAIEVNFEALPHGVLRLGKYTMSAVISQSRMRDDFWRLESSD